MRILYRRCAGLDVHKASVVACVLMVQENNCVEEQVRRFGTMTEDLRELAAWLNSQAVERVAMESTGVYWKPVWNILEAAGQGLLLANAQQVKALPGRKTDQKDSQWLADLLMHGLLRNSFVPSRVIRDLRDLTRSRARLAQWHGTIANRIQKVLEDANIKLASVASDVLGASGRLMLRAIMGGNSDVNGLADLSKGRLRAKIPELRKALEGQVTGHHRLVAPPLWGTVPVSGKTTGQDGHRDRSADALHTRGTGAGEGVVTSRRSPSSLPTASRAGLLDGVAGDQRGEWLQHRR